MQDPRDEELRRLRARVAELQAALRAREEEVGMLRLQLDALSTVDPASGLLNRNGVIDAIEAALNRLQRQREPFAVLGLRLHVLELVARQSREAFEEALRHCGALVTSGLRAVDRCGRLDSTTYCSVLPLVIEQDVPVIVGRLNSIFTAAPLRVAGEELELRPVFSVVLVGSGRPADVESILVNLARGLRTAEPGRPWVHRL